MQDPSRASSSVSPERENSTHLNRNKSPSRSAKRKRDDEKHGHDAVRNPAKRKKSQNSQKSKEDEDHNLDLDRGLNLAIAKLDNRLLADYIARRTKRFFPDLSLVELEDRYISETAFHGTTSWGKPRTLQDMPSFLEHYNQNAKGRLALCSASQNPGSPHTLVITSAGLRAADITRALRTFQTKEAAIAKLFAKHIKLREAVEYVRKTRMGFGVGTPSRIIDLVDSGALSLSDLEQIVVDCSHIDQKKRGIFDMRELQEPLIALLNRSELKNRYGNDSGKVRLLLY